MILARTPLRVSFFGGGTDFPDYFKKEGGAVLGTAIDKYIYHTVLPFHSHLFDYSMRIAYSKVEKVKNINDIEHAPFREIIKYSGIDKNIEVSITSDLPAFSGLGSSSSFTVGLLNALSAHKRELIPHLDLAYKAIDIEQNILHDKVGCQDQVFAAVGGLNLIEFKDTDNITVHKIPLPPERRDELNNSLLLFFTGIKRRASDIEQKKMQNLNKISDHLKDIRKQVDEAYQILTGSGSLTDFGKLLDKTWNIKKNLAKGVSNPEIDEMYNAAIEAGALGGKLLGAGGGGFLLFYVPEDKKAKVRKVLANYYEISFNINAPGSHIVYA